MVFGSFSITLFDVYISKQKLSGQHDFVYFLNIVPITSVQLLSIMKYNVHIYLYMYIFLFMSYTGNIFSNNFKYDFRTFWEIYWKKQRKSTTYLKTNSLNTPIQWYWYCFYFLQDNFRNDIYPCLFFHCFRFPKKHYAIVICFYGHYTRNIYIY